MLTITLGLAMLAPGARAASLSEQLPAGALLTLETRDAGGALERLSGLIGNVVNAVGGEENEDMTGTLDGMQELLKGSLGKEAALGVFTVGTAGKTFTPHVLAVSRVDELSGEFFGSLFKKAPAARVGVYTFSRQGDVFAGMAGGLVYVSTDKGLLMGYLGRLSGKDAPRLVNSVAYTRPTRSVGAQELSLFVNFSATAKVIRGYLGRVALPRLFSPVVDAIDTLGQYAAGFTTTDAGLTAASAHAANAQGKDQPLYRLLTHTTDFKVQDIIPADVEAVAARACAPESGAYTARWLTRLDLFDPLGFLSDSQLAHHLERAGTYLGSECAQVTLAGGMKAGLDSSNPLASLDSSVSYQRVRDMDAAKKHLPEYAASVNAAIAGLGDSLGTLIRAGGPDLTGALPAELRDLGSARTEQLSEGLGQSLEPLQELLAGMKMVYAFRGDYLITAFSDKALQAALAEGGETLAQSADFQGAGLSMSGAGWRYQGNLPDLSVEDFQAALADSLKGAGLDSGAGTDETDATMSDEERAMLEALKALPSTTSGGAAGLDGALVTIGTVTTDLINRYDGLTSQSSVQGSLILSKSSVRYRWE
ncbi:hypothetical protein CVO96_05525 [Deinococcus koreensis]|uniref:DUF3352 domain-containing protein n=1 Tax=Deinococcus koreensis TaxID=2054903 RepID=A0A2K3V274_9DEIO|nr:hypothetical protein CVO96_05525 [Deinococcus koreensis]